MQPRKAVSREEPPEVQGDGPDAVQYHHKRGGRKEVPAVHGLGDAGDGSEQRRRGYLLRRRPEEEEEQGCSQVFCRVTASVQGFHRSHRLWKSRKRKKKATPAPDTTALRGEANRGAGTPS